jgi:regulator of PEP synthase PpsR (kinase-PPPase family)
MSTSSRYATFFHIHLVSDSTGETLNAMARAVCARFENVLPIEHYYALVRSPRQLERALADIEDAPGMVMHTIVDDTLRAALEEGCRRLDMPCIAALDPLVSALSGIWARRSPGGWGPSTPSTPTTSTGWTP